MSIEIAARTAHEVNRAYSVGLGDTSHSTWEHAPEWQRASAIAGAKAIANDPSTTSEQSHKSWSKAKLAEGWVFGEVKDATAKTHPCLVPYAALPAAQKIKDALFGLTVRGVLAALSEA